MDQRGFLSHNSTRCILVFFENTMSMFNKEQSISRRNWFENFRDYLNVSALGYANSKESDNYSEVVVFDQLKYINSSVKNWLIECAIEMIISDKDFDLSDVNITANRISKALDIQESDFYNIMKSKYTLLEDKISMQNEQLIAVKKIYYSKYKTTGLFYSQGEYVLSLHPNETISLYTADHKLHYYDIESLYEDRNDRVFIIRSQDSGKIGEFRLKQVGKAELSFSGKVILKLLI